MGYGKTDQSVFATNKRWYKVPDSGSMVFFCPPREGERRPFKEIVLHRDVLDFPVACFKQFGHATCPICDANNELFSQKTNVKAQELSKKIYGKKNYIYNIIPDVKLGVGDVISCDQKIVEGQLVDPEIKTFSVSKTVHDAIGALYAFNGDVFDPTNGNVILLSKIAVGGSTIARIQVTAHPKKIKLDEKLLALLNTMHDLNKVHEQSDINAVRDTLNVKMASVRATTVYSMPQNTQQIPQQVQVAQTPPWVQQPLPPVTPTATTVPVPVQTTVVTTAVPVVQTVTVPEVAPNPVVSNSAVKIDEFEEFLKFKREQEGK